MKIAVLGLAALLGGAVAVQTVGAQGFEPTATIVGTVTDRSGAPLGGICVSADIEIDQSYPGGAYYPGEPVLTGPDGRYELDVMPIQNGHQVKFRVSFGVRYGCGDQPNLVPQFWNGKENYAAADLLTLTDGETREGIDATLREGGRITGQVVGPDGEPGERICAIAMEPPRTDANGTVSVGGIGNGGEAETDSSGRYVIEALADGTLNVHFRECGPGSRNWLPQSYDAKRFSKADPVRVTAGATAAGIDARMQRSGSITGTARDIEGNPLAGVCVNARPAEDSGDVLSDMWESAGPTPGGGQHTTTGADGTYRIDRLRPGGWLVSFGSCMGPAESPYALQWWNGKHFGTADRIDVGSGQTVTDIDATMRRGARLSGTISSSEGKPVPFACAVGWSATGDSFWAQASQSGRWRTHQLVPEGVYYVMFSQCFGHARVYAPQFYDGQASVETATPVEVVAGQDLADIDAHLVPRNPCVVPELDGKRIRRAKSSLDDANCTLGKTTRKRSAKPRGVVLKQRPSSGAQRPRKAAVRVVLSAGRG